VETKFTQKSGKVMKTGVRNEKSNFTENILSDREMFVHSYVNHSLWSVTQLCDLRTEQEGYYSEKLVQLICNVFYCVLYCPVERFLGYTSLQLTMYLGEQH
jgi:hypothetical protein